VVGGLGIGAGIGYEVWNKLQSEYVLSTPQKVLDWDSETPTQAVFTLEFKDTIIKPTSFSLSISGDYADYVKIVGDTIYYVGKDMGDGTMRPVDKIQQITVTAHYEKLGHTASAQITLSDFERTDMVLRSDDPE
jgi:hypothetical protein